MDALTQIVSIMKFISWNVNGLRACVKPKTDVKTIEKYLPLCDQVLVMTVELVKCSDVTQEDSSGLPPWVTVTPRS